MAVFLPGVTACPICGRAVQASDDSVNFPPLFMNQRHDVVEVTDAVVHRACLLQRPYADQALRKLEAYEKRRGKPKICRVCGQPIGDPDDYFGTGPLADDEEEPIARWDWFEGHVSCLRTWEGTQDLADSLAAASADPGWEGDVLQALAVRLREIATSAAG